MSSLSPKCGNTFLSASELHPFLIHYEKCLPSTDNLENEILTFKNYLTTVDEDHTTWGLHRLLECITPVEIAFPILTSSIKIALTIGTSTASVERSFSSLRRLKTYLRSTMTQERLDKLALLYIERNLSSDLWNSLEDLVVKFAQRHKNSRIILL